VLPRAGVGVVCAVLAVTAVAATGSSARATQQADRWCQARSSSTWKRALSRHSVPLSLTTPLHALAIAGQNSFFAEVFTKSFTGVALVHARTGHITRIKAFPDPTPPLGAENGDEAVGAFDGRWFVWYEYRDETRFNRFTIWAWNSRTRQLRRIGITRKAADGQLWDSPWHGPDVRAGIATWVQGSGPDGLAQVHVYDLRAGKGRVIHTGHAQGSFLLADHVVAWPESPKRGAYTRIYTASAVTGKRRPAPVALRVLRGISGLYSDGRRIAYPSAKFTSLWWSPSLSTKPQMILRPGGLRYVDNDVQVGGRYIGFGVYPHVFVADMVTRRYVTISDQGGLSLLNGTMLLVYFGNGSRAKTDPISKIALVPQRDLPPIPACRS
jgi:hypothetical protein